MKNQSKQHKIMYPDIVEGKLVLAHEMIIQTISSRHQQYASALQKYALQNIYCEFEEVYRLVKDGLISKEHESQIAQEILDCIEAGKAVLTVNLGDILLKLAHALAFLLARSITPSHSSKSSDDTHINAMRAGEVFGILLMTINWVNKESLVRIHSSLLTHQSNQVVTHERNVNAAKKRHAQDPKTQEKHYVHECYLAWVEEPDLYESIAQFSKAMARDCQHLKCNPVTVGGWIKAWKK